MTGCRMQIIIIYCASNFIYHSNILAIFHWTVSILKCFPCVWVFIFKYFSRGSEGDASKCIPAWGISHTAHLPIAFSLQGQSQPLTWRKCPPLGTLNYLCFMHWDPKILILWRTFSVSLWPHFHWSPCAVTGKSCLSGPLSSPATQRWVSSHCRSTWR